MMTKLISLYFQFYSSIYYMLYAYIANSQNATQYSVINQPQNSLEEDCGKVHIINNMLLHSTIQKNTVNTLHCQYCKHCNNLWLNLDSHKICLGIQLLIMLSFLHYIYVMYICLCLDLKYKQITMSKYGMIMLLYYYKKGHKTCKQIVC